MKKTLVTLAFLCVLIPSASAQWYLFPGSPQQKKEKAQQESVKKELERIHGNGGQTEATEAAGQKPAEAKPQEQTKVSQEQPKAKEQKREPWVFKPKYSNTDEPETETARTIQDENVQEPADTCVMEEPVVDEFILDIPETINLALLLPIKSNSSPSSNFLDYYSGALMAVRDLGRRGINLDFNVFDTADATARITADGLADADVIIGPVASEEIRSTLGKCPEGKFIVSPLEPKAAALVDECNIIQVPSASGAQLDELINWVKQDMLPFDKLVVVKDESLEANSESSILLAKLEESGIQFSTIDTPSFIVDDVTTGTLRLLVASERNSFLCSAVNAAGKLGATNGNVVLYSTSKLRSLEGINAESLFSAQCHMVSSYFIDYTDDKIKSFVLSYRALFGAEPSSFAFHGYDSISFFASMCAEYGRQWYKKLPGQSWEGLQTDFRFLESETAGMMNSAIRRVVYRQDLSIALQ